MLINDGRVVLVFWMTKDVYIPCWQKMFVWSVDV